MEKMEKMQNPLKPLNLKNYKIELKNNYYYVTIKSVLGYVAAGDCIWGRDSRFQSKKQALLYIKAIAV